MLKSVRVPPQLAPPFQRAERFVEELFADVRRRPEQGTIHVGEDRYVLLRAESFYVSWHTALESCYGEESARELIYETARAIGQADCEAFSARLGVTDGVERLASGPIHFAHAGWALVDVCEDSAPAMDQTYYLHYLHPNTFESEVLKKRGTRAEQPSCVFSAGYSSGWCSHAFEIEVHARELRCVASGDDRCEFVMAPIHRLEEHAARVRAAWSRDRA